MAALRIMLRMPKRSRRHTTGRRPGWSGRRCCTLAIGLPPKRWGPAPEQKPPPHGGASSLRWMRKCQAHRSLPRDLLSSAPNTSLRKARPVVAQGGLSAFHPLFVIIRARRRTNHQTLHSLSRPDPIHHQPTNRLPEPASHSCPRQRKTDQAKTPQQDFPRQTLPISALPG